MDSAVVGDEIAAYGESYSVGVGLLWSVVGADTDVGRSFVAWKFMRMDPGDGTSPCYIIF